MPDDRAWEERLTPDLRMLLEQMPEFFWFLMTFTGLVIDLKVHLTGEDADRLQSAFDQFLKARDEVISMLRTRPAGHDAHPVQGEVAPCLTKSQKRRKHYNRIRELMHPDETTTFGTSRKTVSLDP